MRRTMWVVLMLLCLGFSAVAQQTLYRYGQCCLLDSKWGKVKLFQQRLGAELQKRGLASLGADGKFGDGTRKAIVRINEVPDFAALLTGAPAEQKEAMTDMLFAKLVPDVALPSVHERAFTLSLTLEATDYDRVQWNYKTPGDEASGLTWGPFGATVGHGHEVQAVLRRLNEQHPEIVLAHLPHATDGASGVLTIENLLKAADGEWWALLRNVYNDPAQRPLWESGIEAIGATQEGRAAYDWYGMTSGRWVTPAIKSLYGLVPNAGTQATEVDYAFFLDMSMHASISKGRVDAMAAALKSKQQELGRDLKPAERRQVIGNVLVQYVSWKKDRLARNVVFYIDALDTAESPLGPEEKNAWLGRSKLRASDCGLSDDRLYCPSFLKD